MSRPAVLRRIAQEDRGSLPLAMLAILAVSAIVAAVAATTVVGTQATSFDQQYLQAIQIADNAAQEGASQLIRGHTVESLQDEVVPAGCSEAAWANCTSFDSGNGTEGNIAYTWDARKIHATGFAVRADATTPGGVTRTVIIHVEESSRFFLAAFSDRGFEMRGSNTADSYGASAWYTGNGIVGSNGTIRLHGSSTGVDGVQLFDWAANPDVGRCVHTGGPDCDDVLTMPVAVAPSMRINEPLDVGSEQLETQFIDDQYALCPAPVIDYTASVDGATIGSPSTETVLCVETFTADTDITVLGTVEVYVYGDLLVGNDVSVNCAGGCTAGSSTPDATALSFYVDGSGDPANASLVALGNHSEVAAGVYAPESDCEGNPSNAVSQIFGSMICGEISNQGGWSFHYDDRLTDRGIGNWAQTLWREEV